MPRYKKKRTKRKKRSKGKGYSYKPSGDYMSPYQSSPLKQRMFTTLKYAENFTLNGGVLAPSVVTIRGNDCFDPYGGVGGHQPRGFDEIMSMYNHFTVLGSRINVVYTTLENAANTRVCLAVQPTNSSLSLMNDYLESGSTKYAVLPTTSYINGSRTLSWSAKTKHVIGVKNVLDNVNLSGTAAASPAEMWYWHIGSQGFGTSDVGGCECQVLIEYDVCFTEPKTVTQS